MLLQLLCALRYRGGKGGQSGSVGRPRQVIVVVATASLHHNESVAAAPALLAARAQSDRLRAAERWLCGLLRLLLVGSHLADGRTSAWSTMMEVDSACPSLPLGLAHLVHLTENVAEQGHQSVRFLVLTVVFIFAMAGWVRRIRPRP